MELKLHFSKEEMREYLQRKGYRIHNLETWDVRSVYHNKTETVQIKLEVASMPGAMTVERNFQDIERNLAIENVFAREIKISLLNKI